MKDRLALVLGLCAGLLLPTHAQTTATSGQTNTATSESVSATTATAAFDTTGFPQWAKDLRRGEIIAFGSFPFSMFFSLTLIDTYRMATHDWDTQYAPWPFKGAGAVDRTEDEQMLTITMAVTTSLVIALVDFVIHRYKRAQEARKREALPAGVPIIIRTPLSQEATESAAAEAP